MPQRRDLNRVRAEFLETFVTALLPLNTLDRFKLAGVIATLWTDTLPDFKTLLENGFPGVIDGWVDAIADAVEDDEAAGPAFDPFAHRFVRRTMSDYLERIAAAKADVVRLKGEKEAFEQGNAPDDLDERNSPRGTTRRIWTARSANSRTNGSIPWVTPSEITALCGKYVRDTREKITPDGLAGSAAKLLPEGSVVVTTRATLGETAIAAVPLTTNQGFKSIMPNEDTDSLFAYNRIQTMKSEMVRLASGTTFLEISKADFSRIRTHRPKRTEQIRIAAVLDTMDEAIAKTEAVIAKLWQVRTGILHDFLTRGLDAHGQLRDPAARPEQFKDSPLGRIPSDWEVRACHSLCREIVVGIVVKPAQYYVGEGVPVLRSANIREDRIKLDDLVFISQESNALLSKSMLHTDDLVTVRTGYPGTTCVVPSPLDGSNCVDLIISQPGSEIVPRFLALWINSPFGKDQVLRLQGGLAQQHFNVGEMKRVLVAKPQPDEQKEIVKRLDLLDSEIAIVTSEKEKLALLKSGLLADLLTGRVRVPEAREALSQTTATIT